MPTINWEAVIGVCALMGTTAGIVHYTVKAVLNEFENDLRSVFATKEWQEQIEKRVAVLESAMRS